MIAPILRPLALLQGGLPPAPGLHYVALPDHMGVWFLATIIKLLVVFTVYMVGVALLTLAERKISAWIQDRHGPNRVGWHGLLQPAADGLKNIMKEETYPSQANLPLFILAPTCCSFTSRADHVGRHSVCRALADGPWGLIWTCPWRRCRIVDSCSSSPSPPLGVYGIVLAGWSSNNKYSLLGGLRSSAQMVSYEIAMGMSTIPVLLLAGNRFVGADRAAAIRRADGTS